MTKVLDALKIDNYELDLYVSGVNVCLSAKLDGVLITQLKLDTNMTLHYYGATCKEGAEGFRHIALTNNSSYTFHIPVENLTIDEQHNLYKKISIFLQPYVNHIDSWEDK